MAVTPLHWLATTLVLSVVAFTPSGANACDRHPGHRGRGHDMHGASTATVVVDDTSFELVGRGPDGSIRLSFVEGTGSSEEAARTPQEQRHAKRETARARREAKRRVRVAFRDARREGQRAPSPEQLAMIAAHAERDASGQRAHAGYEAMELRIELDDGNDSAVFVMQAESGHDDAPRRDRHAEREARRETRQARKAEKLERRAADLERRAAESRRATARR